MREHLGLSSHIRPREKRRVSYFFILFFLLGCGMAIGHYSADVLFLKRYGLAYLPIMFILHGLLLAGVVTVYTAFADRLSPEKLLIPLCAGLLLLLAAVWWLMTQLEWVHSYPIYYLSYELAAEIFIVHGTFYLSSNFYIAQSKRLIPSIFNSWQLGAILGSLFIAVVTPIIGVQNMPLVWVSLLGAAMLTVFIYYRKAGVSPYYRSSRKRHNALQYGIQQLSQGVSFARKSKLLRMMSIALFCMMITVMVMYYSVSRVYTEHFADENSLAVFFGWLGVATGVFALVLQDFVSEGLIQRLGLRHSNLIFPSLTLGAFAGLLAVFALPAAMFASGIKDAVLPAIRNPVRTLFIKALPGHIQGRAQIMSLGVVIPLALFVTGLLIWLAQSMALAKVFLLLGLFSAIAYWFFNWQMNKCYLQSTLVDLRDRLFAQGEQFNTALQNDEQQVFKLLVDAAKHEEPEVRFMAAKTLMTALPKKAAPIVLSVIESLDLSLRDQLISGLVQLGSPELKACLHNEIENGDEHLKATALSALFQLRDSQAKDRVESALDSNNPRIRAAGIFGVLNYPLAPLMGKAMILWREQLGSPNKGDVIAALNLFVRCPQADLLDTVLVHLRAADKRVCLAAIDVLDCWPSQNIPGITEVILELVQSAEPQICAAAAQQLYRLPEPQRLNQAQALIEDHHPEVRRSAASVLFPVGNPIEQLEMWLLDNRHSPKAQRAVLDIFHSRRVGRAAWERVARCFIAKAAQFYAAYLALDRNAKLHDGLDLLRVVLRERALQTLDLTLFCAMQYEDRNTLGEIRAGVMVQDKQHRALTLAAVGTLADKPLARALTALLESMNGEIPKETTRRWRFHEISSVLDWVKEQGDAWLVQCVADTK